MSDKLKPCRHCGGKAKVHYDYCNFALVQCSKCGISTLHRGDKEEAIRDWNANKPMERLVERLEEENKRSLNEMYRLHGNNYETVLLKKHNDSICEIVKEEGAL